MYKFSDPSKWSFKGLIYVLVNGRTYSAGSTLARYLREYGDATVIGSETGTRYEGFAGGSRQIVHLPNTNLKIGIPRYHISFPVSVKQKAKNRGLLPDHEIEPSIECHFEGRDLHMEKVLSLITSH